MNNETIPSNEPPEAEESLELIPAEPGESALTGVEERPTALHARKRTKWQREQDLEEITRLLAKRLTAPEIATALNSRSSVNYSLSLSQIRYDIRTITERAMDSCGKASKPEFLARELLFLDQLDRAAADQYERSQNPSLQSSQTSDSVVDSSTGETATRVRKAISKAQRDGDTGLLTLRLRIIDQRCRLLGLYNVDLLPERPQNELSDEELEEARQMERILIEELEYEIREKLEAEFQQKLAQATAVA